MRHAAMKAAVSSFAKYEVIIVTNSTERQPGHNAPEHTDSSDKKRHEAGAPENVSLSVVLEVLRNDAQSCGNEISILMEKTSSDPAEPSKTDVQRSGYTVFADAFPRFLCGVGHAPPMVEETVDLEDLENVVAGSEMRFDCPLSLPICLIPGLLFIGGTEEASSCKVLECLDITRVLLVTRHRAVYSFFPDKIEYFKVTTP
jgi:hypothetical protein